MNHIYMIELHRLADSPTQPRTGYSAVKLHELAASVRTDGVLQPILARPITEHRIEHAPEHDLEIVAGHRRVRAARLADLTEIPAIVRPMTDIEVLRAQAVENIQRDDMSPLETATALQHLVDAGERVKDIAIDLGLSERYVYRTLQLQRLQGRARDALADGVIGVELATLILRHPPTLHDRALELIAPGGEPCSLRKARSRLQTGGLTRSLMSAPFNWLLMLDNAGPCTGCPLNSSNNPDLEQDIGPDMCTDPTCYAAKCAKYAEIEIARLHDVGFVIFDSLPPAFHPDSWPPTAEVLKEAMQADPPIKIQRAAYVDAEHRVITGILHDEMTRLRALLSPAPAESSVVPSTGGAGGDETSVATPRDTTHEEPSECETVPNETFDAIGEMVMQITDAVLSGPARPDSVELGMIAVAMTGLADLHDAHALVNRPTWRARMSDVDDVAAGQDTDALTRGLVANALRILATSPMLSYTAIGRPDRLISTLQYMSRKYLPTAATAPEGEGEKASAASAAETMSSGDLAAAENVEAEGPRPGAGAEVMDEAGHPAGMHPDPAETPSASDRFERARLAGHAAGLADIRRDSRAYLDAKAAAGIHPDSQEEWDWDMGYSNGTDELAMLCAAAETRGGEVARQSGSGRYTAGLIELTGSAVESGPIAEAYKRGYTASSPRPRPKHVPPAKYIDPQTGQTWSGRGLKPRWLAEALANGHKLSEFEARA